MNGTDCNHTDMAHAHDTVRFPGVSFSGSSRDFATLKRADFYGMKSVKIEPRVVSVYSVAIASVLCDFLFLSVGLNLDVWA